jgi:hypothetical protein
MTVLQSTPLTLGLSSKRVVVLDALRRRRNVSDYTGDAVDNSTAENCIAEARRLIGEVVAWRAAHRPKLAPKAKS